MAVENPGRVVPAGVRHAWERFGDETREAWSRSPLSNLSSKATAYVLEGARETYAAAGDPLPPPPASPGQDAVVMLVVSGLVRTYRSSGVRQVTTRYTGPCGLVGIPSVFRYGSSAHGEVVADAHILRIAASRFRELVHHDAESSWVVMQEVVRLHDAAVDMACANVFFSVRQRVAMHLLDLAVHEDGQLVVHASHQDIADAIGSVREVVSRVVRELRSEGLVARSDDAIVLKKPASLVAEHR